MLSINTYTKILLFAVLISCDVSICSHHSLSNDDIFVHLLASHTNGKGALQYLCVMDEAFKIESLSKHVNNAVKQLQFG